ncbi:hypothetical protein DCCM_2081 [Desulfocucumis palustris]|uniref:Uncharacterized protein n=1 Tax=Desulfocucumis palustris TaxID=1898651 RepID=A0A2L2XAJ1_9FIRM|nr:hypothetical protein DCCM_2081 [Desulfocucumis palustris]
MRHLRNEIKKPDYTGKTGIVRPLQTALCVLTGLSGPY